MAVVLTDDFTGTNDDPWDESKWVTAVDTNCVANILNNQGRMLGVGNYLDWISATVLVDDVQDGEVLVSITPNSGSTGVQYFKLFLRSSGENDAEGQPNNGYEFRANVNTIVTSVYSYRWISDTDTSLSQTITSRSTPYVKFWIRMQVMDDGANTMFRVKSWDDGAGEPGTWDIEYTDTTPGALHGTAGALQFVTLASGSTLIDNLVDDVTYTSYDAGGEAAEYGKRIDLDNHRIVRVVR